MASGSRFVRASQFLVLNSTKSPKAHPTTTTLTSTTGPLMRNTRMAIGGSGAV